MKVLIVDDEPLVRRSLKRAFASRGHEVRESVDGLNAVKDWNDFQPELVLLDVLMPGLSGPEVLKIVDYPSKYCKVILMSAFSGDYNLTADSFISKPFQNVFEVVSMAEKLAGGGALK
jgi:CheY-like chemotaxis protein